MSQRGSRTTPFVKLSLNYRLLILIILTFTHALSAQSLDRKIDLWVTDYKNLSVGVGIAQNEMGLTEETVRTRTELRLRESGIKPAARITDRAQGHGLYVFVNFVKSRPIYEITIKFTRVVQIVLPDKKIEPRLVTTWDTGYLGYVPTSDRAPILSALDELLDDFLNDYLKANQ